MNPCWPVGSLSLLQMDLQPVLRLTLTPGQPQIEPSILKQAELHHKRTWRHMTNEKDTKTIVKVVLRLIQNRRKVCHSSLITQRNNATVTHLLQKRVCPDAELDFNLQINDWNCQRQSFAGVRKETQTGIRRWMNRLRQNDWDKDKWLHLLQSTYSTYQLIPQINSSVHSNIVLI